MSLFTTTHTRLTALCPGLPRWANTRKVKPIWILLKQETVSGSVIRYADYAYASLHLAPDNHTSTPSFSVLQAECPSAAQPTLKEILCLPQNSDKNNYCQMNIEKFFDILLGLIQGLSL